MHKVQLLFHPDDDPQNTISIATNKPAFTNAETLEAQAIMARLFELVEDACYPVAMEVCGLTAAE